MIIGVTSFIGAGKDVLAKYLEEQYLFNNRSISDAIRDEMSSKGLEINRTSLQDYANLQRSKEGNDYFARKTVGAIISEPGDYVVTSIRHPDEISALRNLDEFCLVFVDAHIATRYNRIVARKREGEGVITFAEFRGAEQREMADSGSGQQLGVCRDLSDVVINNEGTLKKFYEQIDEVYWSLCLGDDPKNFFSE